MMNKIKNLIYIIVYFAMTIWMLYAYSKEDTNMLILASTMFLYHIITVYYDAIKDKLENKNKNEDEDEDLN